MVKSNLIELLKTFSPAEIKEFGEFVKSPFFNKNDKVTALYNVIRKSYPGLESSVLSKDKVFKKIYPGEKFRDNTLRLLMFYLYECAKKFIQMNRFQKDTISSNLYLVRDLIDRDLLKEAEKVLKENIKALENTVHKNEEFFWNNYINYTEYLTLQENQYADRYEKYMTGKTLENLILNLTDNYLLRLLKLYTVVLNTNAMFKTGYDVQYYRNVLGMFERSHFKSNPVLEIYYLAAKMLECPEDENYYYEFKKLVMTGEGNYSHDLLDDLYINLENYCVRKGRVGKKKFDRELFDIYNIEIDRKLYKNGNYMLPNFYKSAVATAMMVDEHKWAEKFIEEYKNELVPEYRESVYRHCYARVFIYKKDYNKALEYLSKVRTDEIYLKTETKLLFAFVYFELGIDDSLSYLLDTMRHFFKNDRFMSDDKKNFYWDFVKILNKLNTAKFKASLGNLFEIKELINSKEKLFLKNWLLEKANELENNAGS